MEEPQDWRTPPGVVAARRARAAGAARGSGAGSRGRAYPAVEMAEDHEALTAVLAATRALLRVTAPAQVADVVSTLVHDLGGGVVPARLVDERHAVQIDVSLGLSEPMLAWADPVSPATMRLTTVLPGFVEDARLVLADLLDGAPGSGDHPRRQRARGSA
ncbi:MAG: hypothetical protein JWN08_983 [Frankiales bacterium]|nr:hypothetical protein [Frankiales bacterium]